MTQGLKLVLAMLTGLLAVSHGTQAAEPSKSVDIAQETHVVLDRADLDAVLSEVEKELAMARVEIESHQRDLAFAAQEIERSKGDLKALKLSEVEKHDMLAEIANAKAEIKAAKAELERAQSEIDLAMVEARAELERARSDLSEGREHTEK